MPTSIITRPLAAAPAPRPTLAPAPPGQAVGLAMAVVETMIGRRPLHHLRAWLSPEAFDALASVRRSGRFARSQVGSFRCQMPTDRALEASIKVSVAARWLVCVLRLDLDRRWACSQFEVLGDQP